MSTSNEKGEITRSQTPILPYGYGKSFPATSSRDNELRIDQLEGRLETLSEAVHGVQLQTQSQSTSMRETDDMMLEIDEHINRVEEEMVKLSDQVKMDALISMGTLDTDSTALYSQVTSDMKQMETKIKENMALEFQFLADEWRTFVGTYEAMRSEIDELKQDIDEVQNCKHLL